VSETRFWLKLGSLALGLGALVFYLMLTISVKGGNVTMPDLKGLPKAGADLKLRGLGLQMQVKEERYSNTSAYSAVLEQSVEPGATIKRGRVIAVVLSLGSQTLVAPELQGMASARQARLLLEQNGLVLGNQDYVSSELPRETVLAQAPEGGQALARGDHVSLLVSSGPPPAARMMPNLRGVGLDAARSLVGRMGLVLRRVMEVEAKAGSPAPGTVLSQSLDPASRVESGQELTLNVVAGTQVVGGARLVNYSYEVPEEGVQEKRVRISITDSRGQRLVYDAMEQPGAAVKNSTRAWGPAKLSIKLGDQVVEEKDLP
jgi:beta-lactam-binding protein with PASTA domain